MKLRACIAAMLLIVLIFTSFSEAEAGRSAGKINKRIDALLEQWDGRDSPGVAVLVQREGKDIYRRCVGMADLELGVPIGPATCFDFASVSKHLTAFGILLLAQEGKIGLDDPVRKYLPELPPCAEPVLVRHLMHQSSGLWEFWTILNRYSGFNRRDYIRMRDVITLLEGQPALNFEPGSRFQYTNTNYSLLSLVVERAGGAPFDEWMKENVFSPLGMKSTHFQVDCARLIPNRAASYLKRGGAYLLARPSNVEVPGSAHAFTNIEDMSRWLANFRDKGLGGGDLFELLYTPGRLGDGAVMRYAAGLIVDEWNGVRTVSHAGQTGGYKTMLVYCPEEELGVVVMANERSINATDIAFGILDICLDEGGEKEAAGSGTAGTPDSPEPFAVSGEILDRYAGGYLIDGSGQKIGVFRSGERLVAAIRGLGGEYFIARSETEFSDYSGNAVITFQVGSSGEAEGLSLRLRGETQNARRIVAGPDNGLQAEQVGGYYYCPQLGSVCSITEKGGELMLDHRRYGGIGLHRIDRDDFFCEWGFISLERGEDRSVTGFRLTDELFGWQELRFARMRD